MTRLVPSARRATIAGLNPRCKLEFPNPGPHLAASFHTDAETENMKRIFLFIATNLAVVLLLSVVASVLGVDRFLTQNGLDLESLLWFSLLMGFGGSFISLLISKQIALWSTGAHIIESPEGAHERWLVDTVKRLADKANIGMPAGRVVRSAADTVFDRSLQ